MDSWPSCHSIRLSPSQREAHGRQAQRIRQQAVCVWSPRLYAMAICCGYRHMAPRCS